jgi:hypothetical protein
VIEHIDLAYTPQVDMQRPAPGTVLSYPCEGTSGTYTRFTSESINPVPGRDLAKDPLGQAIYLTGDFGAAMTIGSAHMQEKGTGTPVALRDPTTGANDPNEVLDVNEAMILPDGPLKTATAYVVAIEGTNNGVSFVKTFTFTTGAHADATSVSP